jgi:murein DD-endopeptidase MepM/ murein hydrolase activator NlpD
MEEERDEQRSAIRRRLKKLRRSYVLALVNRRTFEQKGSIALTPLNLLFLFAGGFMLMVFLLSLLVSFTPIKRFIPGFPGKAMEERSIQAMAKADSLEYELHAMKEHFRRMRSVLDGRLDKSDTSGKHSLASIAPLDSIRSSTRDVRVRKKKASGSIPMQEYLFPPLRGSLTDAFDPPGHHFGVDLTASEGASIKATYEGTVVFSSWTPGEGNVIQIQHPHGLLSVYKHNSVLLKEAGQKVRTGDPIAIIGNTGSMTTGPHLHFELWYRGDPVDPEKLMVF